MPPKKKKRPDTHLKDYLEERDVLLEFLKVNELRSFCKKLHKTWEALDKEKGLELEKLRLLDYWKTLDEQLRECIEEKRDLEIFKIDKTLDERISVLTEKKTVMLRIFRDSQICHDFQKSRVVNQNNIRNELSNRNKELMQELHKARKKCIIRKYDEFRSFMYSNVVAYKKFLPIFYKFSDQFVRLQGEYYDRRYMHGRRELKKQGKNELCMLKRKERLSRNSVSPLITRKHAIRILYHRAQQGNEVNTTVMKKALRRAKGHYFFLRRKEEKLKKKMRYGPNVALTKEINSRTNILRLSKDIFDIKKKLEEKMKVINEQICGKDCQHVEVENNYCNEKKFVNEVRKLTLDEADHAIINHMAKKLLSSIKLKSIKKKIRILYYTLRNVLKSDAEVDRKVNAVVNAKKAGKFCVNRSKIFDEEGNTNLLYPDNDPFYLNCVPDIHISGFVPAISMHQTCKDFIVAQKQEKLIDYNNKQPEEQFKLLEQNVSKNRCTRLRIENCLKNNNSHLDNVPINIKQEAAPKFNQYIKSWETEMKKMLQKSTRYQRYYEADEEDEIEEKVEGEVEGEVEGGAETEEILQAEERVQGEEREGRIQEEIEREQDEWEEEEKMEIDKEVLAEEEEDDEDSVASSTVDSYMSSATVTSSFY